MLHIGMSARSKVAGVVVFEFFECPPKWFAILPGHTLFEFPGSSTFHVSGIDPQGSDGFWEALAASREAFTQASLPLPGPMAHGGWEECQAGEGAGTWEVTYMGVSIVMGVPQNRWFIVWGILLKWKIWG